MIKSENLKSSLKKNFTFSLCFAFFKALSILSSFQNKDGRVTKRDFRRVLESFCFRMNQTQFSELMARIDPHNKGYISYLEFLDAFEPRETMVGNEPVSMGVKRI